MFSTTDSAAKVLNICLEMTTLLNLSRTNISLRISVRNTPPIGTSINTTPLLRIGYVQVSSSARNISEVKTYQQADQT